MPFCESYNTTIVLCLFIITFGFQNGMASVRFRDKRFTKVDICYETSKTLEMVGQCPTNATIFQQRSLRKTCDLYPSCSGIPLVYHCVKYKDGLAEVCAPRDQITGFCCALYDEGVGRVVEDYNRPCSNCSFRYPSDNIVKYPQCVATIKTPKSVNDIQEDTPNHNDRDTSDTPCNKGMIRNRRHTGCSDDTVGEDSRGSGISSEHDSAIYAYTIAPAVIAIVCLILAITYCKQSIKSKESNACLSTEKESQTIKKADDISKFTLLQSDNVEESCRFTSNSNDEDPNKNLVLV